jgi:CubicO group peptidase (beta-lactamase class C family)
MTPFSPASITPAPTPLPTSSDPPTAAPADPSNISPTVPPAAAPTKKRTATPIPAPTTRADAKTAAALDRYMQSMLDQGAFNGSVLVTRDGRILLEKGYGPADSDRDLPSTSDTKFRIASLTKQFTAMGVLILQAQGKLEVTDRVCRYLPDCPADWGKITIRQLLTHTSGIPDLTRFSDFDEIYPTLDTPQKSINYFRDAPLDFAPGQGWEYSNSGYILLGNLIQQVSGLPYEDFLQKEIFSPLGMQNTGYDESVEDLAVGYTTPGVQAGSLDPSWLYSAGGLYSSVDDLYHWDQALYTGQLFPRELIAEMFKPQIKIPANNPIAYPGTSYGYGWLIGWQLGHHAELHTGMITGFSALIERFPDDRLTIILLSNLDGMDFTGIAQRLAGIVFGK